MLFENNLSTPNFPMGCAFQPSTSVEEVVVVVVFSIATDVVVLVVVFLTAVVVVVMLMPFMPFMFTTNMFHLSCGSTSIA